MTNQLTTEINRDPMFDTRRSGEASNRQQHAGNSATRTRVRAVTPPRMPARLERPDMWP